MKNTMNTFCYEINGGNPIEGEVTCLGAKNFATKALVASLLGDSPTTLTNVPPIGDVDITKTMLSGVGTSFSSDGENTLQIDPSTIKDAKVMLPDSGSNRIPILMLSALLHRFSEVFVPSLAGCNIGERKVDFHLDAIRAFGGTVEENETGFIARRNGRLKGAKFELPYPSVGATETCLYLSVCAEGQSVISNIAVEPEILELIFMLQAMGAMIYVTPKREIRVEGVKRLKGTWKRVLGDRIEAASWAALACASDGDILVKGIRPGVLGNFLSYYRNVGGGFQVVHSDSIRFFRERDLEPVTIQTDVYPGFSTDWQQPFAVLLTQADGISIIHETVYEKRFGYLRALNSLGAKTQVTHQCLGNAQCRYNGLNHNHSAIIIGATKLKANTAPIEIPDLRAGLAYVIAAAIAEGTTILTGISNLERGYGNIVPRLSEMNLSIRRQVI